MADWSRFANSAYDAFFKASRSIFSSMNGKVKQFLKARNYFSLGHLKISRKENDPNLLYFWHYCSFSLNKKNHFAAVTMEEFLFWFCINELYRNVGNDNHLQRVTYGRAIAFLAVTYTDLGSLIGNLWLWKFRSVKM